MPEVALATDEDRARQRDRLRFRCGTCENQVSGDDSSCPACGASRPARGWVRVTELVVHDRLGPQGDAGDRLPTISGTPPILSGTPARPPVHRTLYLEAPGASAWFDPSANHTVGLAMTFLGTFVATTFLVLAVFFGMTGEAEPPGIEPTAAIQLPAEVAAAPAILPAGSVLPDAPGAAAAPVAADAPGAADTPNKGVDPLVAAKAGVYTGNIDGSRAEFVIGFSNDGTMRATIEARGQLPTEAQGTYRRVGEVVIIDLEDEGAMTVSAYRGKITGQKLSGQVTLSTGEIRYFTATR